MCCWLEASVQGNHWHSARCVLLGGAHVRVGIGAESLLSTELPKAVVCDLHILVAIDLQHVASLLIDSQAPHLHQP